MRFRSRDRIRTYAVTALSSHATVPERTAQGVGNDLWTKLPRSAARASLNLRPFSRSGKPHQPRPNSSRRPGASSDRSRGFGGFALSAGMIPSIPSRRSANPKRTWRQTQIHANFFQEPPIAVLSLFSGLAALARGLRPSPLAAPAHSRKIHTAAVFFKTIFSLPVPLVARRAPFSDCEDHIGHIPI
jgi:hypothetical protein